MPKIKTKYATISTGYSGTNLPVSVEMCRDGLMSIQIRLPNNLGVTTIDFSSREAKKLADAILRELKVKDA